MAASRGSSWTNSDGLKVGFGPQFPERLYAGVVETDGGLKEARLQITKDSTFGSTGAKITIKAGQAVRNVYLKVGTAWVGGTSLAVGDAGNTSGWITAAQGAEANLTAGVQIVSAGAYAQAATPAQLAPKVYAVDTDLYVTSVGTHTAGDATLVVEYQ